MNWYNFRHCVCNSSSECFHEIFHEFISQLNDDINCSNSSNIYGKDSGNKIVISLESQTKKKYPMIVAELYALDKQTLELKTSNSSNNLRFNLSSFGEIYWLLNSLYPPSMKVLEMFKINEISTLIFDLIQNMSSQNMLSQNISKHMHSTISNPNFDNNQDKILKVKNDNVMIINDSENECESENESDDDNISDIIKNEQVNMNTEQQNEDMDKKSLEIEEQKYSIFMSEKETTYPRILEHFINKYISWNSIPPLFMSKFPIFLYLDGRDLDGNSVGERILDTDDEYYVYTLLYDALFDENFDIPSDEKYQNIIKDFMNHIPPIPLITSKQLMEGLNDSDDEIFNDDDAEHEDMIDMIDTEIDFFQMKNRSH